MLMNDPIASPSYYQVNRRPLSKVVRVHFKLAKRRLWRALKRVFSTPDLDYAQFRELEAKRTRHQVELEKFF